MSNRACKKIQYACQGNYCFFSKHSECTLWKIYSSYRTLSRRRVNNPSVSYKKVIIPWNFLCQKLDGQKRSTSSKILDFESHSNVIGNSLKFLYQKRSTSSKILYFEIHSNVIGNSLKLFVPKTWRAKKINKFKKDRSLNSNSYTDSNTLSLWTSLTLILKTP